MNILHLKQSVSLEQVEQLKEGKFSGVGYSGGIIEQHGFMTNLVIDLASLKISKPKKTPVLRDHMTNQVAGSGVVTIDKEVKIEGQLNLKTSHAMEIINLSEDVDWEMSLGVYGGQLREFKQETINGVYIESGVALENGTIREISFVILGADSNTSAEVFNVKKLEGETIMKLSDNASYVKLACACGGHKDTTPEELQEKFAASQEAIDKKQAEIDALKADLVKAQEEMKKMKDQEETSVRAESLVAAAKEKGIELSQEAIDAAKVSAEATTALVNTFKAMQKIEAKTNETFRKKVNLGGAEDQTVDMSKKDEVTAAAKKLVAEGKAKNFAAAVQLLNKQ